MSAAITAAARFLQGSSAAPRKTRETKRQSVYKPAKHIVVRSPTNTTRKSPNKEPSAASAAEVKKRVGNFNKTKQVIKNAVAAAASNRRTASNRQSVVTVAIPKNDPTLFEIIRRLLGMKRGNGR
jgi:hypothetical protein